MKICAQAMQLFRSRQAASIGRTEGFSRPAWALLCTAAGLLSLAGCGSTGAPQPPSLKLPNPPTDVSATRVGGTVSLRWTMPRRAVDNVTLTGDQRAVVCRSLVPAPCVPLTTLLLQPGAPASYSDSLPAALQSGKPGLLAYTVLLQNHRGKGAGPSNAAYTAAGAAPPPVLELQAKPEPRGIVLRWQPAPSSTHDDAAPTLAVKHLVRLHRTRLTTPGAKPTETAGALQPADQTLQVADGSKANGSTMNEQWLLDLAIDRDAALNQTYRYTVARIARLTLGGRTFEVASDPSSAATVEARDLFPPAVPLQLDAVADNEAGAIDLSWVADTEPDLAGYFVYRRVASASGPPTRVSGSAPLVNPGWRDTATQPGVRYAYSVSAVDASGNESGRSAEAEESVTLAPPKPGKPAAPGAHGQPHP